MFEQALILRAGLEKNIDVGMLAETLFFYGSAHLLLDSRSIVALADKIPGGDLLAVMDREAIKVSYNRQNFAVLKAGMPPVHDFAAFMLAKTAADKKRLDYREEIEVSLERRLGKSRETKKLAHALADRVKIHKFTDASGGVKSITDLARADMRDSAFVNSAAKAVLQYLVPTYPIPAGFYFQLFDTGQGFAVDTNLNFEAVNELYHQKVPIAHSSITAAYLLSHILDARSDTFFAAYYMAEPVTAPVYSEIIKLKHFDFLRRRQINSEAISQFHDIIVPDFPTIRETLNEGRRSFARISYPLRPGR